MEEETAVSHQETSIEKEMRKSYLDYAMSVIIGRALPDVRDGLKPVHRRILFAMHELKNDWNKPYKKSARVVGDVIGKYHPHGDTAVYDAIVRMAQDFSMRYPFVDGQGNFGSVDGDSPAAMRYTEVRMQKLAHLMLEDIDKETVDFVPNYDESLLEPSVLPARLPALLINGSSGIAVGMATNIPPHNLSEVADAICAVIDNPGISTEAIMKFVSGPDFPTYGIIHGVDGIKEAYSTGKGKIRVRGRVLVEKGKKGDQPETIVISELPYQVNKARLIEKIAELVKNKVIEGIRYVRDESDKDGMRIAIGLKKNQLADVIINQLYKHTQLETTFGMNMLAVVNNRPELLTLKEILEYFILHRKEIIIRRTAFDLRKAEERAHILEGLKIAIDNLDEVVAMIRKSASPADARASLIERFELTMVQAQAILDMRLQKLTGLEREKIVEEYKEILKQIAWFKEILANERIVLDLIKQEMEELKRDFGDERRTEIMGRAKEIRIEDMIAEEDMVVTVTNSGYIKRNPISLYRKQQRGGRGKTAMGTKEDDFVDRLFIASTHHTLMFFTTLGRVFWRKVFEIPQAGRASRGTAIVNLLQFNEGEELATVLNVPEFSAGQYVLFATRQGMVKKTDIMDYSRPRSGGLIAIGLGTGDELIAARITDGTRNVFLGSRDGKSVRFLESDVRPMGRLAKGVRGMTLGPSDRVVAMEVLSHGNTLLTVTENGFGKRTSIDEYPVNKRGGKGVITIKTSLRNGKVVAILLVEDDDDVMIMTDRGKLIRIPVSGISVISRNTQGVRLIVMEEGEKVTGAARLAEKDDDEIGVAGNGEESDE